MAVNHQKKDVVTDKRNYSVHPISHIIDNVKVKVKFSCYRPEQALGGPEG
jgi:hypothetical protein